MLITCPLIQEEVRQGREPPLRLPWLHFKQRLASRSGLSGCNLHVIKRHNSTISQLFYIKSESQIKNPQGRMEAFNSSFNCAVIMRLWGGQQGLIPVTSCGTNITEEGTEEWSDRQVNVFDSTHFGKIGECVAVQQGRNVRAVSSSLWRHCWFKATFAKRAGHFSTGGQTSGITTWRKVTRVSSVTICIVKKWTRR